MRGGIEGADLVANVTANFWTKCPEKDPTGVSFWCFGIEAAVFPLAWLHAPGIVFRKLRSSTPKVVSLAALQQARRDAH